MKLTLPPSADSAMVDMGILRLPRNRVFEDTARAVVIGANQLLNSGMPYEDVLTLIPECLRDEFPADAAITPVSVPVGSYGHVICYTGGTPLPEKEDVSNEAI